MLNYSSSSADEDHAFTGHVTATDNNNKKRDGRKATTFKNMRSLFMEDDMQSKQGVTSLRYEDQGSGNSNSNNKALSNLLMDGGGMPGQPSNTPSPLQTAAQAVVLAYRGEVSVGPCVVAACVPRTNTSITAFPIIAIVDREKNPNCRLRLDESLQLLQNNSEPQFASLYDPGFGGHWSLMFKGRRECTEFVAAVHTTLHYLEAENNSASPFMEWGTVADGAAAPLGVVSRGDAVSVSFMVWLLQRVPNTRFFSTGKMIEEVPLEAPREVVVGGGAMMDGIEELLVGMGGGGTSRLAFVSPKKTRVRRGIGNPEVSASDTVVVHITCHEITRRYRANLRGNNGGDGRFAAPVTEPLFDGDEGVVRGAANLESPPKQASESTHASAAGVGDVNTLLQTLLVQTLQQQQPSMGGNKRGGSTATAHRDEGVGQLYTLERSIERVHVQLASLYEKIDRLSIDERLEKNNAVIERIVKKALGKAPVSDVDVEDVGKDRDALLATIERLKGRLEEERSNYHHALESISRHKDDMHGLQNDLQIQREAHEARVRQLEDQRRLQIVEAEVQHRQALDRIADEKYSEGRNVGYTEGVQAGRREALEAAGEHSNLDIREQLLSSEKHVVQLETELQEREARHIAERRRLREQIDALQEMTLRMEKRSANTAAGSRLSPDTTVAQQCKVLNRALNAAYTNIVSQLTSLGHDSVALKDVLQVVLVACSSEARNFTDEIKREAMLQLEPVREGSSERSQRKVEMEGVNEAVDTSAMRHLQDDMTAMGGPEVECVQPDQLVRELPASVTETHIDAADACQ